MRCTYYSNYTLVLLDKCQLILLNNIAINNTVFIPDREWAIHYDHYEYTVHHYLDVFWAVCFLLWRSACVPEVAEVWRWRAWSARLCRHSLPGETEPLLTVPTSFLEAPEAFQTPPQLTVETELNFPDSVIDSDSGESPETLTPNTWAEQFEALELINSIRETNGSDTCSSCKGLGTSRLHEVCMYVCSTLYIVHESKFTFVARIEFIRSSVLNLLLMHPGLVSIDVRPGQDSGSPWPSPNDLPAFLQGITLFCFTSLAYISATFQMREEDSLKSQPCDAKGCKIRNISSKYGIYSSDTVN